MAEQTDSVRRYIHPLRFIPFDVGVELNDKALSAIGKRLATVGYSQIDCPILLRSLSHCLVGGYKSTEKIEVYLYKTGIGVIVFEDSEFPIEQEAFGAAYCEYRRKKHEEIRLFRHQHSPRIKGLIEEVRKAIGKCNRRISGYNIWENGGISYVMTVSVIVHPDAVQKYQSMSDVWKKNMLMMLEPSLAHEEDSLITHLSQGSDFDPYDFSVEDFRSPVSRIKSKECAIYASWAAVLVLLEEESRSYVDFVKCLEIDLQAMWMYLYCLVADMKDGAHRISRSLKDLRNMSFKIRRYYSDFQDLNDSSAAVYFKETRNELLETSGVCEQYKRCQEYIDHLISETESRYLEGQKKFATMSEALLFIITFAQIAPLCYDLLNGGIQNVAWRPLLVMASIVLVGLILIFRKGR